MPLLFFMLLLPMHLCGIFTEKSTVVKHPDFYYHLTTIDGLILPHFAAFRLSHDIVTPISGQRYAWQIAAKRGRIRLFRRLIPFD